MRIPNSFVTRFTQASDLKLACVFYSLIHKNTKRNLLGYEITAVNPYVTMRLFVVNGKAYSQFSQQMRFHKITETSNDYTRQARNIYIHY